MYSRFILGPIRHNVSVSVSLGELASFNFHHSAEQDTHTVIHIHSQSLSCFLALTICTGEPRKMEENQNGEVAGKSAIPESEEEAVIGPGPAAPRSRPKRPLQFEQAYLDALPSANMSVLLLIPSSICLHLLRFQFRV